MESAYNTVKLFFDNTLTDIFWISYTKWYRFYNNNLSVVLKCKQGGTLKLKNPKHEDWASILLLSLSVLTFLSRCQVILQWKQTKEKLRNAFNEWQNFRVDLTWWMENFFHFSRGFCRNFQGYTFSPGYQFLRDGSREHWSTQGR